MRLARWIGITWLVAGGCGSRIALTPMGDEALFEDRSGAVTQTVLTEHGGRVDWSWALDRIAFDRVGEDGYFDVWTMRPDGGDQVCFTCGLEISVKNVGQPAWDPTGRWMVVQVQQPEARARDFYANPGRGRANDLYVLSYPEGRATRITEVADEPGVGVLHPHFSPDGKKLLWSEGTGGADLLDKQLIIGAWVLKAGDFVAEGPRVENVVEHVVGDHGAFYENHGLSPDGGRWIFSANLDPEKKYAEINDIYLIDFPSGKGLRRLTTHAYNEHAQFTPDGGRVVWMSSAGNRQRGTDYWVANVDGTGLARLTKLTTKRSARSIAADLSMGPDGRSFVGYVQGGVAAGSGRVVLFQGL